MTEKALHSSNFCVMRVFAVAMAFFGHKEHIQTILIVIWFHSQKKKKKKKKLLKMLLANNLFLLFFLRIFSCVACPLAYYTGIEIVIKILFNQIILYYMNIKHKIKEQNRLVPMPVNENSVCLRVFIHV